MKIAAHFVPLRKPGEALSSFRFRFSRYLVKWAVALSMALAFWIHFSLRAPDAPVSIPAEFFYVGVPLALALVAVILATLSLYAGGLWASVRERWFSAVVEKPQSPEPQIILDATLRQRLAPCACFTPLSESGGWNEAKIHDEQQDTECDAWKHLLALIEEARAKKSREFEPSQHMSLDHWAQIVTLPASIGTLKSVRFLGLRGSNLVRIPAEIGQLTQLVEFDLYTSYRLHWYPYEIRRCRSLQRSTVSTRALYGNRKYRPPFPALRPDPAAVAQSLYENAGKPVSMTNCSVCDRLCPETSLHRVWISLWVATDVLPLLVNACSLECVHRLPRPAEGYGDGPHYGGLDPEQKAASGAAASPTAKPGMLLVLDDDRARLRDFEEITPRLGPAWTIRTWRDAPSMMAEMHRYLDDARLISLDHDLYKDAPGDPDPGSGRMLANHLARLAPVCPVIVHSRNTDAAWGMFNELSFGKWKVELVHHLDEPGWVEERWLPLARALVSGER